LIQGCEPPVFPYNLPVRENGIALLSEEISDCCGVNRAGLIYKKRVKVLEEERSEGRDRINELPHYLRCGEACAEASIGPCKRHPRPADRAAVYLIEPSEQAAVTEVSKAGKVILFKMSRDHKRYFCIHKAPFFEHAVYLFDTLIWIGNVLEHGLSNDPIK